MTFLPHPLYCYFFTIHTSLLPTTTHYPTSLYTTSPYYYTQAKLYKTYKQHNNFQITIIIPIYAFPSMTYIHHTCPHAFSGHLTLYTHSHTELSRGAFSSPTHGREGGGGGSARREEEKNRLISQREAI